MLLRYSAMLRQSGITHGDFAKTINTPANQLKILSERLITLGRTLVLYLYLCWKSITIPKCFCYGDYRSSRTSSNFTWLSWDRNYQSLKQLVWILSRQVQTKQLTH